MKTIKVNNTTNNYTTLKDKIRNAIANRYPFFNLRKPKTELHLEDLVFTSYEPVETIHIPIFKTIKNEITDKLRFGLFEKPKTRKNKKDPRLEEAMRRLREYADSLTDDDDDTLYFMGKRIKFYDNFIQVGDEIISLYDYDTYFKEHSYNISFIITLSYNID